jgi:hypothetical protein
VIAGSAAAIRDAWELTGDEFRRDYLYQTGAAEEFKVGAGEGT